MSNLKVLAFDTCLDKMYVAVCDGQNVLKSEIVETTKTTYHSAFLISTIANLMQESGLSLNDIDVFATNIGPGSFTGIRACVTVTRVMAQGLDAKAVGISSLELLSSLNNTDKKTLVALDARKEMAYVAIYNKNEEILSPRALPVEEVKEMIESGDYFVVTDDKMLQIFGGVSYQGSGFDFGYALAQIALSKVENIKNAENAEVQTDWRKLLPLYIQPPALNIKKTPEK